jgi:anti-sigma B factor antagonist
MNEKKDLAITYERRDGGVVVIRLAGSADHIQYYKLEEAIQTQLDKKQLRLVLDLSDLVYISSAGINAMGHAASQYERIGGALCYVRPVKTAQWQFFTTIGVDQIFPWAVDLEEAIRKVSGPLGNPSGA